MFLIIVTFCSGEYPSIERNTIFSCEVIAHADTAKLYVGLDFSCVKCAVEKSEFHCTLGEERMEIYSMISCGIVMLMIDSTAITIICSAIPDFFGFFFCKILILFHGIK